jgi:protein-tyrosine phosphatase
MEDLRDAPAPAGLGLVGAPNARDLGGHVTVDGRRVRPGVLLRAGALGRLADRDVAALDRLRLSVVIDLRDASEIRHAPPDRLPGDGLRDGSRDGAGPVVRHIPLFDPAHPVFTYLSAVLLGHDTAAYAGLREEGTPGAMTAVYRWFAADARARAGLAEAVRAIADAAGAPVLFHCSAGKDRTGWLAAILLEALGVDRATVVADYLATNALARAASTSLMNAMRARGLPADPAILGPVLEAREAYLAAAYEEVAGRFGDMGAYLRTGLGLTEDTLATLRENLLYEP